MYKTLLAILLISILIMGCYTKQEVKLADNKPIKELIPDEDGKVRLTDQEWKEILTDQQYKIGREGGTEAPFTGEYYNHKDTGSYVCSSCGTELFDWRTKYDSGCGWPSFYAPSEEKKIKELKDTSHGMIRIEIRCNRCDAHLGHVFNDGPNPTGLRYCVNSASLKFIKKDSLDSDNKEDSETNK